MRIFYKANNDLFQLDDNFFWDKLDVNLLDNFFQLDYESDFFVADSDFFWAKADFFRLAVNFYLPSCDLFQLDADF